MKTEKSINGKLGLKIRYARKSIGLSQKQLGQHLHVSDKAVSSYEIGRTAPSFQQLKKISSVVHKPLSYFDEIGSPQEPTLEEKVAAIEKELREVKTLLKKRKNPLY
jgi:transcriptional regulator with XRE-family HTH domain